MPSFKTKRGVGGLPLQLRVNNASLDLKRRHLETRSLFNRRAVPLLASRIFFWSFPLSRVTAQTARGTAVAVARGAWRSRVYHTGGGSWKMTFLQV